MATYEENAEEAAYLDAVDAAMAPPGYRKLQGIIHERYLDPVESKIVPGNQGIVINPPPSVDREIQVIDPLIEYLSTARRTRRG